MRRVLGVVCVALLGCGAPAQVAPSTPRASESAGCAAGRAEILEAMRVSRAERACAADADCAVVTGPGHPAPDYEQVVHASDAAALDARADAHLAACGAFHRHDEIGTYTEVTARCVDARCAAEETIFHPD